MYHVHFGGKSHGPYLLDQIRGMWERGLITADATYWAEGETEWKPLVHLLASKTPTSAITRPEVEDGEISSSRETAPKLSSQLAKKLWNSNEPRPWRRMWARILDLQILVSIPVSLLVSAWLHFMPDAAPVTIMGISAVAVLLLEPVCLSRFGNTPGKWLLGISLRKSNGDRLSLTEAVVRFLSVLWRLVLPLVAPIFMLLAHRDLRKRGATKWDRKGGYTVTYRRIGAARWFSVISLIFLVCVEHALLREQFKRDLSSNTALIVKEIYLRNNPAYASAKEAEDKKDYEVMLRFAKQLIISYPNSGLAQKCLGDAYYYMGSYDDALVAINKALEINPQDVVAWYDRGNIYFAMKQFQAAEKDYRNGLKINPFEPFLLAGLGEVQIKCGQFEAGLKSTQSAESLLENGDFNDHHREIKTEWVWKAISYNYNATGKNEDAHRAMEKALACNPTEVTALCESGFILLKLRRPSDALQKFEKAINSDPMTGYAWHGLGRTYKALGQYVEAKNALVRGVELDPGLAYAWNDLGFTFIQLNQISDAVPAFERAATLAPDDALVWIDLGCAYNGIENCQSAIEAFEKAVALNPNNKEFRVLLSEAYSALGKTKPLQKQGANMSSDRNY